jgi:hypothetical protein
VQDEMALMSASSQNDEAAARELEQAVRELKTVMDEAKHAHSTANATWKRAQQSDMEAGDACAIVYFFFRFFFQFSAMNTRCLISHPSMLVVVAEQVCMGSSHKASNRHACSARTKEGPLQGVHACSCGACSVAQAAESGGVRVQWYWRLFQRM